MPLMLVSDRLGFDRLEPVLFFRSLGAPDLLENSLTISHCFTLKTAPIMAHQPSNINDSMPWPPCPAARRGIRWRGLLLSTLRASFPRHKVLHALRPGSIPNKL